jgi:hypothetical protein
MYSDDAINNFNDASNVQITAVKKTTAADKTSQAILDGVSFLLLILFCSRMFISSPYTYFIHGELVQRLLFLWIVVLWQSFYKLIYWHVDPSRTHILFFVP